MLQLRESVYKANMLLKEFNLVKFTWGNVSGIDREKGLVVIKPSGVNYDELSPDNMVVTDLDGKVVEGKLNPSSDLKTHLELYKAFPDILGVVHAHSPFATAFAQAKTAVLPFGTTHADVFYGEVPCTRELTDEEINSDYEKNTGTVIAELFKSHDYSAVPGVLVASHGPFAWGKSPYDAVHNMVVLEECAKMNYYTMNINPNVCNIKQAILDKHYNRKHGKNAYYGQKKEID